MSRLYPQDWLFYSKALRKQGFIRSQREHSMKIQTDKTTMALVQIGEWFDDGIEWSNPSMVTITPSNTVNPANESGYLCVDSDGIPIGWGYAGYNEEEDLYWRYKREVNPASCREYCLRIISIL